MDKATQQNTGNPIFQPFHLLRITPVQMSRKNDRFDLAAELGGAALEANDILVVSSKFVSMSEGRVVHLKSIRPSGRAVSLALESQMDAKLCELVLREADYILTGVPGFLLAIKDGMIAPNAGIDKSNVPNGYVILYPEDPFGSARRLRKALSKKHGFNIGVVISDSRLMPTRIGTTGVAIACAGFEPVEDLRGRKDLFGNTLRVTQRAVADSLATMGVAAMGESNESTPAAIIRGATVRWSEREFSWDDMAVAPEIDIYLSERKDLVKISRENV